jgi:D-alanyl-lipoteichoic acid acyltransferase DltB (MBOAT superfamily)
MLFPTIEFAVFFAVVLAVSWVLPAFGLRWKLFILGASYFFYGYWDWRFVGLIIISTLVNWTIGAAVAASRGNRLGAALVALDVIFNLGVLALFKYYGFFITSLGNALHPLGIGVSAPLLQVILPVGISFFTFQGMSYVIDLRRGATRPARLLDFAVYLAFFPHVVAGPIVRAVEFIPQLRRTGYERRIDASRALFLILSGLVKKMVLASFLATHLVDSVFESPKSHSSLEILVAIYGYAVQIYADFSGYTDMAIGCALLLGIRFPDNFNAPYTATSLQDFWRRWHMTLSRWLRDYLYVPLGGSRKGRLLTYRNLMITMLLGGLWHGAAWTFVIWGGIHGAGLSVERFVRARRQQGSAAGSAVRRRLPSTVLSRLATFHVVCLAWVFFRSDSLGTAWQLLSRLVTAGGPAPGVTPAVLLAIAVGIGAQYIPGGFLGRLQGGFSRLAPAIQGAGVAASLLLIGALGPEGVAPFIYFRF